MYRYIYTFASFDTVKTSVSKDGLCRMSSAVHILQRDTKTHALKKNVAGLWLRQSFMIEIKYINLV